MFNPNHRWGLILALCATAGFSMKAIFAKLAYPYGVDVITLILLRMVFAVPFFWLLVYRAHRQRLANHASVAKPPRLTVKDFAQFGALGFFGYYAASFFDFAGLQYISAGLERLILYTYPTIAMFIGLFFFKKPVRRAEWWALPLCYSGIGLAFAHDIKFVGGAEVGWGAGLVFASSLSYAIYLSTCGGIIARLGSLRFSAWCMSASTLLVVVHYWWVQTSPIAHLMQPLAVYVLGFAMAIFSTVLPVVCMNEAIHRLGAANASLAGMIGPMLTLAFGWWWLSEPISWEPLIGALLVIAGVWLANKNH